MTTPASSARPPSRTATSSACSPAATSSTAAASTAGSTTTSSTAPSAAPRSSPRSAWPSPNAASANNSSLGSPFTDAAPFRFSNLPLLPLFRDHFSQTWTRFLFSFSFLTFPPFFSLILGFLFFL